MTYYPLVSIIGCSLFVALVRLVHFQSRPGDRAIHCLDRSKSPPVEGPAQAVANALPPNEPQPADGTTAPNVGEPPPATPSATAATASVASPTSSTPEPPATTANSGSRSTNWWPWSADSSKASTSDNSKQENPDTINKVDGGSSKPGQVPVASLPDYHSVVTDTGFCRNSACCIGSLESDKGTRPSTMQGKCLDVEQCAANARPLIEGLRRPRRYAFVLSFFGQVPQELDFLQQLPSIQRAIGRMQSQKPGAVTVDVVLLIHPGRQIAAHYNPLDKTAIKHLQAKHNVKVRRVPWTIPPGARFDRGNEGWCGEQDFIRLHAWNMTDYDAVAYYDNDVELRGDYLPLFECVDGLDVTLTTTGGVGEPINVGFFALKPKAKLLEAAVHFSKVAGFEPKRGGWADAGFWPNQYYFIGAECGQGYWLTMLFRRDHTVVREAYRKAGLPLTAVRAASIDRCVWNYQLSSGCDAIGGARCDKVIGHHKPARAGSDDNECLKKGIQQLYREDGVEGLVVSRPAVLAAMNTTASLSTPAMLQLKDFLPAKYLPSEKLAETTQPDASAAVSLANLKEFLSLGPLPQRLPWPGQWKNGLPIQCKQPDWLVRKDLLSLDVNPHKTSRRVRAVLVVSVITPKGQEDWGAAEKRPPFLLTMLAASLQHLRRFGHGLILRPDFTPQLDGTHLQAWQKKACDREKKDERQCMKDMQRENFNWEKHLMLNDYLQLKFGSSGTPPGTSGDEDSQRLYRFTHVGMLDADAAFVNFHLDSLGILAWNLAKTKKQVFVGNEDWLRGESEGALLSHAKRANGGLIFAANSKFSRSLFTDTFQAHVRGNERTSTPWTTGGIVAQCSSNEQICLSDLMYGPPRTQAGAIFPMHRYFLLGSGKFWNRGRAPQAPTVPLPDHQLHVMHYMGGGRQQAVADLCENTYIAQAIGESARNVLGVCGQRVNPPISCSSHPDSLLLANTDVYPKKTAEPQDPWSGLVVDANGTNKNTLVLAPGKVEAAAQQPPLEPGVTTLPPAEVKKSGATVETAPAAPNVEVVLTTAAPANPSAADDHADGTKIKNAAGAGPLTKKCGSGQPPTEACRLQYSCCDVQNWSCCGEDKFVVQPRRALRNTTAVGFYLHVGGRGESAAVTYLASRVLYFNPGAPIYIMSDGAEQYEDFCRELSQKFDSKCIAVSCPSAEDRWHPWPFFKRFRDVAVALPEVEYLVMLEPDNTLHSAVDVSTFTHDAGGILDHNGNFGESLVQYGESLAQQLPGKETFKWVYKGTGLAGGSYYRRTAILDAFADEVAQKMDWKKIYKLGPSAAVYSSDFAMPIALAFRGWTYAPWGAVRQAYGSNPDPTQPQRNVSIIHYNRDITGGKPATRIRLSEAAKAEAGASTTTVGQSREVNAAPPAPLPADWMLSVVRAGRRVRGPKEEWARRAINICQMCWNREEYVRRFGTEVCAPKYSFNYTAEMIPKDAYCEEKSPLPIPKRDTSENL
ncbi:unnamed protein product [Amoebophrya sp. A120]|nr:unnamed protein product [Amoebophrya sp. A120]|eukprot:GSA120T00025221001.1